MSSQDGVVLMIIGGIVFFVVFTYWLNRDAKR